MRPNVPGEPPLISELHRTHVAVKRFVAHMGAEVLHQVATLHETFATQVALVRLLASMRPLVVLHVAVVDRGVFAERALMQKPLFNTSAQAVSLTCRGQAFMSSHVCVQRHLPSEGQGAELAAERLLACVAPQVFHQVTPLHKAPAAVAALVRPLTGVYPPVVFHVCVVHRGVAA